MAVWLAYLVEDWCGTSASQVQSLVSAQGLAMVVKSDKVGFFSGSLIHTWVSYQQYRQYISTKDRVYRQCTSSNCVGHYASLTCMHTHTHSGKQNKIAL